MCVVKRITLPEPAAEDIVKFPCHWKTNQKSPSTENLVLDDLISIKLPPQKDFKDDISSLNIFIWARGKDNVLYVVYVGKWEAMPLVKKINGKHHDST